MIKVTFNSTLLTMRVAMARVVVATSAILKYLTPSDLLDDIYSHHDREERCSYYVVG